MSRIRRAKRKDGRISKTFTIEGKRYFVYGRTPQELAENEIKKRIEVESGCRERKNPSLFEYYKRFTEIRSGKVKESTIRCQTFQFMNCAQVSIDKSGKKLGDLKIRDIRPFDIQKVQTALEQSGRTTETVNNCMDHLSHVFNAAVRDDTIDKNPCRSITKLKRIEPPARDTIHRALTEKETKLFFEYAKDSYYYNLFLLMVSTGLRIGEAAAIMKADIDTFNMFLHINKTVTRDQAGAYTIGTPKTAAGCRDIPLTKSTLRCINEQRLLNGAIFTGDEGTIFKSPEGAILRDYSVDREINRICRRAGIDKFTCHSFRATFATRFIEQRPQDYKVLSELLGHSDIKITLNLYTHVMKESKKEAMESLRIAL